MSLNLTIDQGNSAAKVTLWDGNDISFHSLVHDLTAKAIDAILREYNPAAAIYCSVADKGDRVISELNSRGVKVMELTHNTPRPITVDYLTPATLGRDRVAAAVGAWSLFPGRDLLVADLGTAITYDVVTADGHYAGGNIAPGLRMRLEALNHFTARLPLVDCEGDTPLWGYSTDSALRAGAIGGVTGELTYYRSRLAPSAVTILTGGDSELIAPKLDFETVTRKHLVSEGLNRILRYNEDI